MKRLIVGVVILSIAAIGFIIFHQIYINVWGFNLPKNDLKDVIVYTKDKMYLINNKNDVLDLAEELSDMKRLNKISPNNFGNKEYFASYNSLILQTNDDTTYGGSFWQDTNGVIQDSNGYYWKVTNELFNKIDKALKKAQVLN